MKRQKLEIKKFDYNPKGAACLKRTGKVLKRNFWCDQIAKYVGGEDTPDHKLYEGQLGFDESTAYSIYCEFDQKTIFQELSNYGYNLIFYWVDDNNMYSIFHEVYPSEVRCLPIKDHRRGIPIEDKYEPLDMHDDGKVVATFYRYKDDNTENPVSDTLKIKGVPIMDVIKRSVIIFHEG